MTRVLMVGLGGFLGAILRYWLSGFAQSPRTSFPIGTLVVNVVGCFLVGVLAQLVDTRGYLQPDTRALVFVGILGGFTTMSTFANETVAAAKGGALFMATANVTATFVLCLSAAWAGRQVAHLVWR